MERNGDNALDFQAMAYQITSPPRPREPKDSPLEQPPEEAPVAEHSPERAPDSPPEAPPEDPRVAQLEEQMAAQALEFRRYRLAQAAENCEARDPELVALLLERGGEEDLTAAVRGLRRERPWLFRDNGGRPRFAAAAEGQPQNAEEEAVERRYRNNPWYRRR